MADGLTQTNEIASKTWRQQERDGAKPDGLTQTNEKASESQRELEEARDSQRGDMELFRQLGNGRTNLRTYRAIP